MTKREMKKMETKLVLELLTEKFNVESFDDEGFGSFTFNVGDLMFQLDRRDYCVSGFDSIPLYNPSDFINYLAITPFKADGTELTSGALSVSLEAGKQYSANLGDLNLPAETAWIRIEAAHFGVRRVRYRSVLPCRW